MKMAAVTCVVDRLLHRRRRQQRKAEQDYTQDYCNSPKDKQEVTISACWSQVGNNKSNVKHHASMPLLRLAVFDLDFTVWQPEMYELWGPPSLTSIDNHQDLDPQVLKEARTSQDNMILTDRSDTPITVFEGAYVKLLDCCRESSWPWLLLTVFLAWMHRSVALSEINRLKRDGFDIAAAVASRTDQESWARTCLKHLIVQEETTLQDCVEYLVEIDCWNDKTHHFRRLHQQTGIPYSEMAFF